MSVNLIRAAFEQAAIAMSPALPSETTNVEFTPPAGLPFQKLDLMMAEPDNATILGDMYREQGFFQILLEYPEGEGSGNAIARAEAVQQRFKRGVTLQQGGLSIVVSATPSIKPGFFDADRYCLPVRIPFFCQISSS